MKAALLGVLLAALALPGAAAAHGPADPTASTYLAKVVSVPPGIEAKVVDGDQRMWLSVAPGSTAVVLDYRGAPYLRFAKAGVQVNQSSAMFFLNQVPAQTPPADLTPATPPRWELVSSGLAYGWHDGRLHALATTAIAPGARFVGRWSIPVRVDGATRTITGDLFHAGRPPIVWFWPVIVVLACVLAGLRLRRPELDWAIARGLAGTAVAAFVLAGVGQQLHGRPFVSVGQLIVLALVVAFGAWAMRRIVLRRHGWFTLFAVSVAAIWEGTSLVAVLRDGFVLLALPAPLARAAVTGCLAAGAGLLPLVFRIAEAPELPAGARRRPAPETSAGAEAEVSSA